MIVGKKLPVIDYKKNLDKLLKIINHKKLGIVVVLKNKFIEGLVTDGDLRRGIKFLSKKNKLQDFMTKILLLLMRICLLKKHSIMNEKKITSLLVVSDKDKKKKIKF